MKFLFKQYNSKINSNYIEFYRRNKAHEILADPLFLQSWKTLQENCPNTSVFQDQSFVCTWYETYCSSWEPAIIVSRNSSGIFVALWFLAYSQTTKQLVNAGAHQSEYQVWLALSGEEEQFIKDSWNIIKTHFNFNKLQFRYLPKTNNCDFSDYFSNMKNHMYIRKMSRPLLNITESVVKEMCSKSSNKSKINRLKKLGELEFRRINNRFELELVLEELISFYDFRQGAEHNVVPFRKDSDKRRFYINLFCASPQKVMITVTYLNNKPIAGFYGQINDKMVHLGMIMHSPFHNMYSPGKIHIIQLCQYLLSEGFVLLDLTPGGDSWKERYAKLHDEVAFVILFRSVFIQKIAVLKYETIKQLKKMGIKPDEIRAFLGSIININLTSITKKIRSILLNDSKDLLYIYRGEINSIAHEHDSQIQCNSLNDLISYSPDKFSPPPNEFLAKANSLFEMGASSYSICKGNRLAGCGFLHPNQSIIYLEKEKKTFPIQKNSTILFNFYFHKDHKNRAICKTLISFMINIAIDRYQNGNIYITINANNSEMRHIIEEMDFRVSEFNC